MKTPPEAGAPAGISINLTLKYVTLLRRKRVPLRGYNIRDNNVIHRILDRIYFDIFKLFKGVESCLLNTIFDWILLSYISNLSYRPNTSLVEVKSIISNK